MIMFSLYCTLGVLFKHIKIIIRTIEIIKVIMNPIDVFSRPPQNGTTLFQNGAVPGRSWLFLERARPRPYLERNDPEQGTTRFQKNGNEKNVIYSLELTAFKNLSNKILQDYPITVNSSFNFQFRAFLDSKPNKTYSIINAICISAFMRSDSFFYLFKF